VLNFSNREENLLWTKHLFWEKGISPNEFRKCQMRDIKDIMDIENSKQIKIQRERKIKELEAQMKHG